MVSDKVINSIVTKIDTITTMIRNSIVKKHFEDMPEYEIAEWGR